MTPRSFASLNLLRPNESAWALGEVPFVWVEVAEQASFDLVLHPRRIARYWELRYVFTGNTHEEERAEHILSSLRGPADPFVDLSELCRHLAAF